MKNMRKVVLIGVVLLACGALMYFAMPVLVNAHASWQRYTERVARQSDYTKITTPLPKNVVDDICSKFEIDRNDVRCLPDAIVYAPDFFGDIKTYLQRLPDQDATFEIVNEILGIYLVRCGSPDDEGYYSCRYDIRGDGIYPIFVHFTKEGQIYRVIANTGGS
jgi:hypothetical protein